MKPIRVLIVDDSPTVQTVLSGILLEEPDIEVVGTASDPFEAKEMILEKKPDVITLDIEMPRMDGITFLKRLMSYRPMPVLMISSYTRQNSARTIEALNAGAVDFVAKPIEDARTALPKVKHEIIAKVRAAAQASMQPFLLFGKPEESVPTDRIMASNAIIAIGASTGGTQAVHRLLGGLPPNTNGIAIVQHMPARFTKAFAQRLDALFPMKIKYPLSPRRHRARRERSISGFQKGT
jgi:two-component system chemotaxis response regulator CheB